VHGGVPPTAHPVRANLKRKLRRRQLTEDGNIEITGRDLSVKYPAAQHDLFERAALSI
jgi:hypothetical protein